MTRFIDSTAAPDRPVFAATTTAAAFGAAVSSQRPYLVRYARRYLHDAALVEDVVQDTLLAALTGADAFAQRASLRTWLTAILRRRIVDGVRDQRRHGAARHEPPAADDEFELGADGLQPAASIDWIDPQRRLESRQMLGALADGLATLPAAAARAIALREIDGLSNDDVARELGLTPGRAALLTHRARAALRERLAPRHTAWAARPPRPSSGPMSAAETTLQAGRFT